MLVINVVKKRQFSVVISVFKRGSFGWLLVGLKRGSLDWLLECLKKAVFCCHLCGYAVLGGYYCGEKGAVLCGYSGG